MAIERTFSIIKPDATARNLTGAINAMIEQAGLQIVAQKRMRITREQAQAFYAVHRERPFFGELVEFMISGPVVVQVLEGEGAIVKYRDIMGATDPAKAAPGTIRKTFSKSIGENSVHGSDAPDTAAKEIAPVLLRKRDRRLNGRGSIASAEPGRGFLKLARVCFAPVHWTMRGPTRRSRTDRRADAGPPRARETESEPGGCQVSHLWADMVQPAFWVAVGQIIWINILLSGDNAVVIALACRTLPPRQRFWGILLGAGAAVLLRVIFTIVIAQIMAIPFLKLLGGLALLWIAVKLIVPGESHGEGSVQAGDTLWRAVKIVAIADIVMSLDNVIAIAAAAETASMRVDLAHATMIKTILIIFGLATSVPLIIAGSALLMALFDRFPILVWAGAGLLGWIAGEIMIKDTAVIGWLGADTVDRLHLVAGSGRRDLRGRARLDAAAHATQGTVGASADHRSAGAGGIPAQAAGASRGPGSSLTNSVQPR